MTRFNSRLVANAISDPHSCVGFLQLLYFNREENSGLDLALQRYVGSTASLYNELEVLNELELATKKFEQNHNEESKKVFDQKVEWQKEDVTHLKNVSLWNQTYDKSIELLARSVCIIYARITVVFGDVMFMNDTTSRKHDFGQKSSPADSELVKPVLSKSRSHHRSGFIERAARRDLGVRPHVGPRRSEGGLFGPDDFNHRICLTKKKANNDETKVEQEHHRLDHMIIIEGPEMDTSGPEERWSDVQPSDMFYLQSEMILSKSLILGQEGRSRSSDDSKVIDGNDRSVSEMTGLSRFRNDEEKQRHNNGRDKRQSDKVR